MKQILHGLSSTLTRIVLSLLLVMVAGVGNVWGETKTGSWDLTSTSSDWTASGNATYFSQPYGYKAANGTLTNKSISDFSTTGITEIKVGFKCLQNGATTSKLTIYLVDKDGNTLGDGQEVTPDNASAASKTTYQYATFTSNLSGATGFMMKVTTFGKNILVNAAEYTITYTSSKTSTTTTFPESTYSAYMNESFTAPTATVKAGETALSASVTYTSSAESVATVDASTGAVTLVGPGTTTIKASYAGDDTYEESSASYTLTVGGVYADIQALQAGVQSTSLPMKLTLNNVTVTGVNGNNVYISDGTYGAIIYTANHGLTAGQTISGTLEAACQLYNGVAEITNYSSTGLTISDGTLGDAPTVSIADITSANESKYCKLENVAYDATAATFSDGTNTIAYYDGLKNTLSLTDGKNYDVVGIVGYRKTSNTETLQFFPISIEEKVAAVEAPTISLATGSYKGTQSVTITEETDGATIYYTLDGTDPTTSGAKQYTDAISISETTTLIAAAKKGDTWSNAVTRIYTIIPLYKDIKTAKEAMTATAASDAVDCYITLKNAVVTAIANSNYYIEDETAGMLIYNTSSGVSNKLTKAGLVLNGDLKCAGYIYNGVHQYTKSFDFTDVTITEGSTIPSTELTIAQLLENEAMDKYESMRIQIVGTTVSSKLASRKATIKQEENTIQVYEKISGTLSETGLGTADNIINVIGYPGINNSTNQFNVLSASDVTSPYTRTVTGGNLGSICIPFGVNVADCEGIDKVFEITAMSATQVTLTSIETMYAGVPYIFRSNKNDEDTKTTITMYPNTAAVSEPNNNANMLMGNFAAMTGDSYVPKDSYILQDNQFKYVADENTIRSGANRCYLKASGTSARADVLGIVIDGEGETTAIDALNAVMSGSADIYDINGRKLDSLRKGINIVNGKKIIVRN